MKKFLIVGLMLCLVGTMIGYAEVPRLRVGTLTGNTGLAVSPMMENPNLKKATCEFQVFKSPDQLVAKLVTGEIDIATLPSNSAAVLYNKGVKIKMTSVIGWGVMYVVGTDNSVKSWKDLNGKTLSVPTKGGVPDLLTSYISKQNGVNLEFAYAPNPVALAQMLIAGKTTLAILPEPWVTEVIEKNPQVKVILDVQKEWGVVDKIPEYPQTCVVVRDGCAEANPKAVAAFEEELAKSIKKINKNPQQAAVWASKHVQLSKVAVEKGLKRCNLRYNNAYDVRDRVNAFLARLGSVAAASIGGKVPNEGFYYKK